MSNEVVPLQASDLEKASQALSRAFYEDPLQRYMLPDAEERAARSPGHFEMVLRYGLRFGEVLTTAGTPQGAIVWLPPDAWEITPQRAAEGGLDQLGAVVGEQPATRFLDALAAIEPFHLTDVPRAHWYTLVVGVAPEAQGLGIGRALLAPGMQRAAHAGVPCYLETAQPANVTFYESLGYRIVRDIVDPASGLRLWTFRWDPPSVAT